MNILEQIYEINFNKVMFNERKTTIESNNTIILGPPKSGKSYLIYDYLSQFDTNKYLYIDFEDYKNNTKEIAKNLQDFIVQNKIEVVVFENFLFDVEIPKNIQSLIITTKQKDTIEGFEIIHLGGLDFEEYLLFDKKHQNSSNSFNSFLKFGNFPESIEYGENKKALRNYEICKLYCDDQIQLEILFLLVKNAGEKKSLFQLFNSLKKEIKISKDRFYKTCELFEYNKLIFFCEKYNQPKATKKIYIHNHALLDIVSYKKNFNNLFKNMIYLELYTRYDDIYYLDNVDFYLTEQNEIILAIPFFNNLISSMIISKLLTTLENYKINKITIVTVNNEQTLFVGEIEADIIPFNVWAVSL
ncbi:ATP-binding protein [Arcobacter sp. 15-2]|uniref:ATP-binding protein n=1 Tax=Arcobacter sp. 15-2 TaxID=3374109 RepID=UPI00399C771C